MVSLSPFDELYRDLARRIQSATDMVVQSGLFAGLKLTKGVSWGNGDFTTKLIGCYEREIGDALRDAVARRPDVVVNVGCADGYYTAGLARLLPDAKVFAFDAYEPALAICRETAALNGVVDRVTLAGRCAPERLAELAAGAERPFLLIDCEGDELRILLEPPVTAFARAAILVECHDFTDRSITPSLSARFRLSRASNKARAIPTPSSCCAAGMSIGAGSRCRNRGRKPCIGYT